VRATVDDAEMARGVGIDTSRVSMFIFALGAFLAALGGVIGPSLFAAALLWWRFYTFYIYIVLGAIVAGNTALRAVRKAHEIEEELEGAA